MKKTHHNKSVRKLSFALSLCCLTISSCSSPIIAQSGNNGNNISNNIAGSTGSSIDNTTSDNQNNGGGGLPSSLPSILPSGSPSASPSSSPSASVSPSGSPSASPSSSPSASVSPSGSPSASPSSSPSASISPSGSPSASPSSSPSASISPSGSPSASPSSSPSASASPTPSPTSTPHFNILVYSTEPNDWNRLRFNTDLPAILSSEGFTVNVTDSGQSGFSTITDSVIQSYDQLWIISMAWSQNKITPAQVTAVQNFRAQNKAVAIITDHYNLIDSNALSQPWGVNFNVYVRPHNNYTYAYPVVPYLPLYPLLNGVTTLASASDESAPIPMAGSTAKCIGYSNELDPNSCFASVLDEAGKGRVLFEGEMIHFADQGEYNLVASSQTGDGPQYVKNVANWLARKL